MSAFFWPVTGKLQLCLAGLNTVDQTDECGWKEGEKGQINRGKGDRNIGREEREQRKDGWKERET